MSRQTIKKYSIPFKKQVVQEYEQGATIYALAQKYGITGRPTIQRWIKRYSRQGVRHKLMTIQSPSEAKQLKELQAENERLKAALAELSLDNFMLKRSLEVVEKELGHPVEKKSTRLPPKQNKSKRVKKKKSS